jgi:hypothetical protein
MRPSAAHRPSCCSRRRPGACTRRACAAAPAAMRGRAQSEAAGAVRGSQRRHDCMPHEGKKYAHGQACLKPLLVGKAPPCAQRRRVPEARAHLQGFGAVEKGRGPAVGRVGCGVGCDHEEAVGALAVRHLRRLQRLGALGRGARAAEQGPRAGGDMCGKGDQEARTSGVLPCRCGRSCRAGRCGCNTQRSSTREA